MGRNVDIRLKNKKKRIFRTRMHSFAKSIRNIIITGICLVVASLCAITGKHFIDTKTDIATLQELNVYNPVQVTEKRTMNVAVVGDSSAKRTIVTISDIGVQDFGIFANKIAQSVDKGVRIAIVDRAGYGFSQDTTDPQTIDQIISDYRAALSKAGVSGPYVLFAHRFGGVYATYWASMYPDEIDGIIYLDGTTMLDADVINNRKTEIEDYISFAAYKIGFQRIVYHRHYDHYPSGLEVIDAEGIRAVNLHSVYTMAQLSEMSLMGDNFEKAKQCLEKNNIPKVYVSSENSFATEKEVKNYFNYKNSQLAKLGLPPIYTFTDDEEQTASDIADFISTADEKYQAETKAFVKLLGACQLVDAPGDVKIYEHKLNAVIDIVVDFTRYLNGDIKFMDPYYDDDERVGWEEYEEQRREEEAAATAPTETDPSDNEEMSTDPTNYDETASNE